MATVLSCRMCGEMHVKNSYHVFVRGLSFYRKKLFLPTYSICTYEKNSNRKTTTVDEEEIAKFGQLGSHWWDPNGEMAPLHAMNKLRVSFIKKVLLQEKQAKNSAKPLQGLRILDVGCGGGILSEPLARLGADVTGIDASPRTIHAALWHSRLFPEITDHVTYKCTTVEDMAMMTDTPSKQFDCVVGSEILEHVSDKETFISASSNLVKPGGHLVITTINKTPQSFTAAIVGAEYVLRLLPRGTHDWHKFVSVDQLREIILLSHLEVQHVHGMTWNPFTNTWSWSQNTCVNYLVHSKKPLIKNNVRTSDESTSKENGTS